MKLTSASIYNLRSIKNLEEINLSSGLDVFIGQNDSGKSTILYALDFFFNDRSCQFQDDQNNKNDHSFNAIQHITIGDMNVENDEIAVLCRVQLNEFDLSQDRSQLTKLSNGGVISILKKCCLENRFEPASGRGTKKSTSYFILKDAFTNPDFNSLSSLKEQELIALMDKYPDSKANLFNINSVGKPENVERIEALLIYARISEVSTSKFEKISFDIHKDLIWPEFTLIDTKTSLDGKHKVIEDAFKKIDSTLEKKFKVSIDNMKADAKTEYDRITAKIKDYAKKNYVPLIEEFSAKPSVRLSIGRDLVMKRVGQKEATHFDLQGDGTKRRMMVAILQASSMVIDELEKETVAAENESTSDYTPLNIWAFDEPELHLHPSAQRDLFNSFNKFKSDGFQIVCSTHSTIFVNSAQLDAVHLIYLNDDLETVTLIKEKGVEDIIKHTLGVKNSDIFFSNLFVVVEGQTEQTAFPIIFEKQCGIDLNAAGVSLIDGKGWDSSKEKIDFLISNLGDVVCLFDSDVKAELGNELEKHENDKKVFFIGTADFEDAFSNHIWLTVLTSDYNLEDGNHSSIWTLNSIETLRNEISPTGRDKNKKFFRLLENYYRQKCREYNVEGQGHPLIFDKKEIGLKIATSAIAQNLIPEALVTFIEEIKSKIA